MKLRKTFLLTMDVVLISFLLITGLHIAQKAISNNIKENIRNNDQTRFFSYFNLTTFNSTERLPFNILDYWGKDVQIGFYRHQPRDPEIYNKQNSKMGYFIFLRKPIGIIEITDSDGYVLRKAILKAVWGVLAKYQAIIEFIDVNKDHILEIPQILPPEKMKQNQTVNEFDRIIKSVILTFNQSSMITSTKTDRGMIIDLVINNANYTTGNHTNEGERIPKVEEIKITTTISFTLKKEITTENIRKTNIILEDASVNSTTTAQRPSSRPVKDNFVIKREKQEVLADKIQMTVNQNITIKGWDSTTPQSHRNVTNLALIQNLAFFSYLELDNKPFLPSKSAQNFHLFTLNVEENFKERNISDFRNLSFNSDSIYNLTRPLIKMTAPWHFKYEQAWQPHYYQQASKDSQWERHVTKQQTSNIQLFSSMIKPLTYLLNRTWNPQVLRSTFRTMGMSFIMSTLYESYDIVNSQTLNHQFSSITLEMTIPQDERIVIIPPPVSDLTNLAPFTMVAITIIGVIIIITSRFTKK